MRPGRLTPKPIGCCICLYITPPHDAISLTSKPSPGDNVDINDDEPKNSFYQYI